MPANIDASFLPSGLAPAVLSIALLMASCGGSSSDSPTPAGPAADQQPPATSTTPDRSDAPPPSPTNPVAVKTVEVASQLQSPWALAFLPDGRMLVTEKVGTMRYVSAAGVLSAPLSGVPAVRYNGQGGLLDVILSPAFSSDRTIYITYAEPVGNSEARTAVARAVLGETGISNLQVIYRQSPARGSTTHFGARLVFDRAGFLFVALGERGEGDRAQDLTTTQGKVVRILPDGSIPADNPVFTQPGALPGIWTYGHRNPQGAALNPATGELWIAEHGPRGGDEINRIVAGRNYGWPRITYGRDYGSGEPLGEGTTAPDVEPPLHYWVPVSVAPAGMAFYTGDKLPGWEGSLIVGTLAGQMLSKLDLQGNAVVGETRHLEGAERIRDVRQGPDGYPYLLTDSGRLLRLVPQ